MIDMGQTFEIANLFRVLIFGFFKDMPACRSAAVRLSDSARETISIQSPTGS